LVNSISTLQHHQHVQLSLCRHFYLLYLLLNCCDGNDAFWRQLYATETAQLL